MDFSKRDTTAPSLSVDSVLRNPELLEGKTLDQVKDKLLESLPKSKREVWKEEPLGKGRLKGVDLKKGGGWVLRRYERKNNESLKKTGDMIRWYPGSKERPYWRVVSSTGGEKGGVKHPRMRAWN